MNTILTKANPWKALLVLAVVFGSALSLDAAQITWDGSDNTSWTDGNNWVGGSAPTSADEAIIPDASTTNNDPTISTNIDIAILTIQGNGVLNIATGASLTVDGNGTPANGDITIGTNGQLNLDGTASLTLTDDISGDGTLDAGVGASTIFIGGDMTISSFNQGLYYDGGTSTVTFNGSGAQSIDNPTGSYAFNNLVINNTGSGVTQQEAVEIDLDLTGTGTYIASGSIDVVLLGDMMVEDFTANTSVFYMYGDLITTDGATPDPQAQNIDHPSGGTYTFYDFFNENENATLVDGDVIISNTFTFSHASAIGIPGKFIIGNNQVTISSGGSIVDYDNTMYFVTDGASGNSGFLTMTVPDAGTVEFPVGPTTGSDMYNPLTMDHNAGSSVEFDVKAFTDVSEADGTDLTANSVDRTWLVLHHHTGAITDVTSVHEWRTAHENSTFDRTNSFISWRNVDPNRDGAGGTHAWTKTQAPGNGTGSNPWLHTSGRIGSSSGTGGNMANNTKYFLAIGDQGSPLPVSWKSFTATAKGRQAELTWETAMEINNSHFEVERSADGKKWQTIGRVEGNGNSNIVNAYSFTDAAMPAGMSTVYYRLKQVDYNGISDYSAIRTVRMGAVPVVQYYPNPATDRLTVTTDGAATLQILNARGIVVYNSQLRGEGHLQQQIDVREYPAGMYFLQIITETGSSSKTFYKN